MGEPHHMCRISCDAAKVQESHGLSSLQEAWQGLGCEQRAQDSPYHRRHLELSTSDLQAAFQPHPQGSSFALLEPLRFTS